MSNQLHKPRKPFSGFRLAGVVIFFIIGAGFCSFIIADIISGNYIGGNEALQPTNSLGATIGAGLFIGVLPIAIAGLMFWFWRKKMSEYQVQLEDWSESKLLRIASEKGGKLTVEELAIALEISRIHAKNLLEAMVIKSVVNLSVTQSGTIIYTLKGIGEDSRNAEEV